MSRVVRRAHLQRMKEKAKRFFPDMGEGAVRIANHLRHCSCVFCKRGDVAKYKEKKAKEVQSE